MTKRSNGATSRPTGSGGVALVKQESIREAVVHADEPRFDTSDLSWDESMSLALMQSRLSQLVQGYQRKDEAGNEIDLTAEEETALVQKLNDAMAEIRALLAKCLIYVPRSFVVRSAPEQVNWSQAENVGRYLRRDRVNEVIGALSRANANPKND